MPLASVTGFISLVPLPRPDQKADLNEAEAHPSEQEEEDVFQEPVVDGVVHSGMHRANLAFQLGR